MDNKRQPNPPNSPVVRQSPECSHIPATRNRLRKIYAHHPPPGRRLRPHSRGTYKGKRKTYLHRGKRMVPRANTRSRSFMASLATVTWIGKIRTRARWITSPPEGRGRRLPWETLWTNRCGRPSTNRPSYSRRNLTSAINCTSPPRLRQAGRRFAPYQRIRRYSWPTKWQILAALPSAR